MADTRRDILQRIQAQTLKIDSLVDELGKYLLGDPTVVPQKLYVDDINQAVLQLSTSMTAYTAATP